MRLIFDANVILNGLFVPRSRSRVAISLVQSGRIAGYISENTYEEAKSIIERAKLKTGVNLLPAFERTLKLIKINFLPRIHRHEARIYTSIKGNEDKALVAVAAKTGLTICTNDLKDFAKSHKYNVTVTTPDRIVDDGENDLNKIVLGSLASPLEGTFYIETSPNWVGLNLDRSLVKRFYFFDSEPIGGLFYENSTRTIEFEGDSGLKLKLNVGVIKKEDLPIKLAFSYHYQNGASLYYGYRGKKSEVTKSWQPCQLTGIEKTYIGSDRFSNNQINGLIMFFSSLPVSLTETGCNNMLSGKATINPWERLSLEHTIQLMFGGSHWT